MTAAPTEADKIAEQLQQVGSEVEVIEFDDGTTAVDFHLFELTRVEAATQFASTNQEALRSSPKVANEVDRTIEKLAAEGHKIPDDPLVSNTDRPTQRSGGLFKSSFFFDVDGTVAEYNLRLPLVSAADYGRVTITHRLLRICQTAHRVLSSTDEIAADVVVRESSGMVSRRSTANVSDCFLGDELWCPHIRSYDCSADASDLLDFVKKILDLYAVRFPDARNRATPDREQLQSNFGTNVRNLREAVESLDIGQNGNETTLTFRLPGSDRESAVRVVENEVLESRLSLPRYAADRHGKILLRRAIEYTSNELSLLHGNCTIELSEESYFPVVTDNNCNIALSELVAELGDLPEAYETIAERSQLNR